MPTAGVRLAEGSLFATAFDAPLVFAVDVAVGNFNCADTSGRPECSDPSAPSCRCAAFSNCQW